MCTVRCMRKLKILARSLVKGIELNMYLCGYILSGSIFILSPLTVNRELLKRMHILFLHVHSHSSTIILFFKRMLLRESDQNPLNVTECARY